MGEIDDYQFPPPSSWQTFETLCLDLWRALWGDPHAQRNGRGGQAQAGVDIFGTTDGGATWAAVQCKGKTSWPDGTATAKELQAEVEKARLFTPALSDFTFAYIGRRDVSLQKAAREITSANKAIGSFAVHVCSWPDILNHLSQFPEVTQRHFSNFVPQRRSAFDDFPQNTSEHPDLKAAQLSRLPKPKPGHHAVRRKGLCEAVEGALAQGQSVHMSAPTGFGKSVILGQLNVPDVIWFDATQHHGTFDAFVTHLSEAFTPRWQVARTTSPRAIAHELDALVGSATEVDTLTLFIDHADGADTGVSALLEELVQSARKVRLVVCGTRFQLRRQSALIASGHLRLFAGTDLRFSKDETRTVVAAPTKEGRTPTEAFVTLVDTLTDGWPIAVQLIRARFEQEANEDVVTKSLNNLGSRELGAYLLESYWCSLPSQLRTLLLHTSIFPSFDYSDAQAVSVNIQTDLFWPDIQFSPFVTRIGDNLLVYHALFWSFLDHRMRIEHSSASLRDLHRRAAQHFLEDKPIPIAALRHAQWANDKDLLLKTVEAAAEFSFHLGNYDMMDEVLSSVDAISRWERPLICVYQGRLLEHRKDDRQALKWYEHAQHLFAESQNKYWLIGIANDIGGSFRRLRQPERAIQVYDDALATLDAHAPSLERAKLISNRANALAEKGDFAQAASGYREAQRLFNLGKDFDGLSKTYLALGHMAEKQGDIDAAFVNLRAAFKFSKLSPDAALSAIVADRLGAILCERGLYESAFDVFSTALTLALKNQVSDGLAFLFNNVGLTCALMNEPAELGVKTLEIAVKMKRTASLPFAGTLQHLSTLLLRTGDFERAASTLAQFVGQAAIEGDQELISDSRAKQRALMWVNNPQGVASADQLAVSTSDDHFAYAFVIEGMLRRGHRTCPSVRELIERDSHCKVWQIGEANHLLADALNVLLLEVSNDKRRSDVRYARRVQRTPHDYAECKSILFEVVPTSTSQPRPNHQVAAIWTIEHDDWIYAQLYVETATRGPASVEIVPGPLLKLSPEGKAPHGDVDTTAFELANEFRVYIAALLKGLLRPAGRFTLSIDGKEMTAYLGRTLPA